jgi:nitroreductase
VPDHGKLAPWRFIVIAGEARMRAGRALAEAALSSGTPTEETLRAIERTFADAPMAVIVVSRAAPHPKIPEWEQVLSTGAVCYALMIAARGFGFGAVWLTGWPTYDAAARSALGLKPEERIAGIIHLGTQMQTQPERARPDLSAMVSVF